MKICPILILIVYILFSEKNASCQNTIRMDFESVPDFSMTFGDWTVRDLDSSQTYFITGHSFPHDGDPIAFIAFNPAAATPAMTDPGRAELAGKGEHAQEHGRPEYGGNRGLRRGRGKTGSGEPSSRSPAAVG